MTNRVTAYIDGFNIYHSIANNLPEKYKWMDYRKLVESFLEEDDVLTNIFLFTATPKWEDERLKRHNSFMAAMAKGRGIIIISGNYKSVQRKFNGKKMPVINPAGVIVSPEKFTYGTFEEKQTDVNIALSIFEGAMLDTYDKALIFSGDSDIAPGISKSRKHQPNKKFHCVLPYNGNGRAIARSCDKAHRIELSILDASIMDNDIYLKDGVVISNPYQRKSKK